MPRQAQHALRHRVEHIETVPDDTVRRFARLGGAASMPHPPLRVHPGRPDRQLVPRLGEERAGRAFRCRDLWAAGARVVLGSDRPIAPYPPLQFMAGARHRRPAGLCLPPHGPGRALTPGQAPQGVTLNAACSRGRSTWPPDPPARRPLGAGPAGQWRGVVAAGCPGPAAAGGSTTSTSLART
ncbi:amidohydrolase family protein [Streptomyces collinus]|uniref:amidohydrolase family protein n=1 Tax=Streptomyces collinus TaxID=42684 RepID=UPI0033A5FBE5